MSRYLALAFIGFFYSPLLLAQCDILKGIVRDQKTGQALPGATVQLSREVNRGSSGNADGEFELINATSDSLIVKFIGYERSVVPIDSCYLVIDLKPSATELNEIVIKSERLIAEEFTIRKIKKLEIYTNPSAKADPLLAVNTTPSATTLDESANISLRGSSPAETGIFLNNVPIRDAVRYSQLNGIGTFSIFNTALISQVQVYPGNPPLEYGNTASGLISLYTDEGIPQKSVNTISASLASVGFYTQRPVNQSSSLTLFGNFQPSAAIKWINPASLQRLKGFNTGDLGVHYFNKLNERTTLKIFAYGNAESFKYGVTYPTFDGNFNQRKLRTFTVANLRYALKKGEISFNQGLSFSRANFGMSTMDVTLRQQDSFSGLNYQYSRSRFEFKAGVSYDYKATQFEGIVPRYDYAMGPEHPTDNYAYDQSAEVAEFFGYGKYFLTSKWILGSGFRKNIPNTNAEDFTSGQLNINYKPAENWNVILSGGRYNKVQLSETYTTPTHIATDQYSFDVSYAVYKYESSLSLFYKHGKQPGQTSQIRGLEWFGRYRISRNLRAQLSVSSLDAEETIQQETKPSRYDINYFVRGNIEYKFLSTWTVSLVYLSRQGSFYSPVVSTVFHPSLNAYEPMYSGELRLPDYNLVDLSISKLLSLGKNGSAVLFAGVGNVPNLKNVRGYSYNFDYSQKTDDLFSLRTVYFGAVFNF